MSVGVSEKAMLGWTWTSSHGSHGHYANPNDTGR